MTECNIAVKDATSADASGQDPKLAQFRQLLLAVAATLIFIAGAALLMFMSGVHPVRTLLTQTYFLTQDVWLVTVWGAIALIVPPLSAFAMKTPLPVLNTRVLAGAGAALFLACYGGHYLLLDGVNLSADEQLADFDAYILGHGRLFWPLPDEWREGAEALNFTFILPVAENKAWVSNYLPGNAGLRAVIASLADPALTSPLLVLLGAWALFRICRRFWPGDDEASIVALALYALSGQILFNGMTAYAMSAHLALNLIWLWLFLVKRPAADLGALAVGFLATGLHQPIFHPLFAIAFLAPLVFEKKFARAAFYAAGYAAIIGFWLSWPSMISHLAAGGAPAVEGASYAERFSRLKLSVTIADIQTTLFNMIRFVTWQHVLFAPLLALGAAAAWKGRTSHGRALLAALLLPIIAVMILLPYQGHGWGFRYLHGALGAAILLAVAGWKTLDLAPARRIGILVATSFASAIVLLPIQAAFMGGTYRAFASIDHAIDRSGADYVIVDDHSAPYAKDLVYNQPDLANRPVRLLGTLLSADLIGTICAADRPTIAFIGEEETAPLRRVYHRGRLSDRELSQSAYDAALEAGCVAK